MDILKFITAGNVDDGKSTFIGRLLHDSNQLPSDIKNAVSNGDHDSINLAHITDGLKSEREQGITIDIAYKYFTTSHRKYIITDAPGHYSFTKNLVTGASDVDAIIILVDAAHGVTKQTRLHAFIASFLNIKQIIFAINKMDLVDYSEIGFDRIKVDCQALAQELNLLPIQCIPISALYGDNIFNRSEKLPWYNSLTIMQSLDAFLPSGSVCNYSRFSVQLVCEHEGNIIAMGKVISGELKIGDTLYINSIAKNLIVLKIVHRGIEVDKVHEGQNVSIFFESNDKIHRGDLLSSISDKPFYANKFEATLCWLNSDQTLSIGKKYLLRMHTREVICKIVKLLYTINPITNEMNLGDNGVSVNEFANVLIETEQTITYDSFGTLPETSRGILIDIESNYTSGAFIINS